MARNRRIAAFLLSASLVLVVAACSGPLSVSRDAAGSESVSQLLSSSLRLASGSVRVEGYLRGVSGDDVNIQGITKGGYPVQCTKPQGNTAPRGQFKVSDGTADETVPLKRGAVKFGDKKNEEDFLMTEDRDPVTGEVIYGDPSDACPQGPDIEGHWVGTFVDEDGRPTDTPPWLVTRVFVRWTQDGGTTWFPYSWTCDEPTPTKDISDCSADTVDPDEVNQAFSNE